MPRRPYSFKGETYSPINPDMSQKERNRARKATAYAIRTGKLVPQPCQTCGAAEVHAHHPDYRKPLEIMWLCPPCHHAEHRRVAEEAGFGIVRENAEWHARWREKKEANRKARDELARYWGAIRKQRQQQAAKAKSDRIAGMTRMAASGMGLSQIAAAFGLSASATCHFMKRHGIKGGWPERVPAELDETEVRLLADAGWRQKQIADRFGVSITTVCKFMQRHSIPALGRSQRTGSPALQLRRASA